MKIFFTGGTGFVGACLVERFAREGHEAVVLTRRKGAKSASPAGVSYVEGNSMEPGPWQEKISECDAVINLAGASIFTRWSKGVRREIVESRILTTRNVVEALERGRGKTALLISASAVGYYGGRDDDAVLYENSPPGDDFLARLGVAWESEASRADASGVRVVNARFGVVMGKDGGALDKMSSAFKLGLGSALGSGNQWFSWIHREDLARVMLFLLEWPHIGGPVNCTAPNPVRNREMTESLAKSLGKSMVAPRVPGFVLKTMFGEFADVLLKGQRVVPKKLLDEGFRFRFPTIEDAFADLARD